MRFHFYTPSTEAPGRVIYCSPDEMEIPGALHKEIEAENLDAARAIIRDAWTGASLAPQLTSDGTYAVGLGKGIRVWSYWIPIGGRHGTT